MSDGNIKRAILRSTDFNLPSQPEQAAKAKSVGDAIAALIRQGVTERDLSGIFCFKCDFKNAELSKVKFDHSVLSFADFSGARLDGASFTEALLESTKFISASLRDANFKGPVKNEGLQGIVESTDDEFYALHRDLTNGPLFNCADLKGASFTGRVIFTFISDEDDRAGSSFWFASFVKANLEQTDLRHAVLIGLDKGKEAAMPFDDVSSSSGGWSLVDQIKGLLNKNRKGEPSDLPELDINERVFRIKLNESAKLSPSQNRYVTSFKLMEMAFAGSNWQAASLPRGMVDYLNSPVDPLRVKGSFVARYPAALFDDGCQPIRH